MEIIIQSLGFAGDILEGYVREKLDSLTRKQGLSLQMLSYL
jgi:hypothetical protein